MEKASQYGHCSCGNYFPIPTSMKDSYLSTRCAECKKHYYVNNEEVWVHIYYQLREDLEIINASDIHTHVGKSFFEPYAEVKNELRDEKKTTEIRKLGKELLEKHEVCSFISLRLRILRLIEYGTIWLYLERKNQASDKNKEISKALRKLKYCIDSITGQITNKSHSKVVEDIASLHESYSKALTMF